MECSITANVNNKNCNDMENKLKGILKENGLTDKQIKQIAPELLFLFSVSTRLLNETLENINIVMWESYMIKGRSFDRNEGKKIMDILEHWASN